MDHQESSESSTKFERVLTYVRKTALSVLSLLGGPGIMPRARTSDDYCDPLWRMPSLRKISTPIPFKMRPMKVLLVFVDTSRNSAVEDAVLQAMKKALKIVNLEEYVAHSLDEGKFLFRSHSHDIVYIDRRTIYMNSSNSQSTESDNSETVRNQADRFCHWLTLQMGPPCTIVAIERLSPLDYEEGAVARVVSSLAMGYDRVFYETERVSLCVQEFLQTYNNDFMWWLRHEANRVLQVALDSVSDSVEVTDNNFRIQYVNKGYERLHGCHREKVKGCRLISKPFDPSKDNSSGGSNEEKEVIDLRCYIGRRRTIGCQDLMRSVTQGNPYFPTIDETSHSYQRSSANITGQGKIEPFFRNVRRNSLPTIATETSSIPCRMVPFQSKHGQTTNYITVKCVCYHGGNCSTSPIDSFHRGFHASSCHLSSRMNDPSSRNDQKESSSLTLEAPIHKVISIIRSVQSQSNDITRRELQMVMDLLQSADIFAAQRNTILPFREQDPATMDLVEGLLTTTRAFATDSDAKRRSISFSVRRRTIQNIPCLDFLSKEKLTSIPEDLHESLEDFDKWHFDILRLENVTNKRPLRYLGLKIFSRFSVVEILNTSTEVLGRWLTIVEEHYHRRNAYHNSTHAADVLQCSAFFLDSELLKEIFTPLDQVAVLLAAAVHDMDHPGRTNSFIVNSRGRLAFLYNDIAVLENHHISMCFQLTTRDDQVNIFRNISRDDFILIRQFMIDMVLATEMAKHFEHLTKFCNINAKKPGYSQDWSLHSGQNEHRRLSKGSGSLPNHLANASTEFASTDEWMDFLRQSESRATIRCMLIKCSDISNPTRPLHLCQVWAERIADEYFAQTEEEKRRNLPVMMPTFDRVTCNIAKSQISFIDLFLRCMMESWCRFLGLAELMEHLATNYTYWLSKLGHPETSSFTVPTAREIPTQMNVCKTVIIPATSSSYSSSVPPAVKHPQLSKKKKKKKHMESDDETTTGSNAGSFSDL
jgi:high affinity cAMP-specific and IBMX-insensitive 3',5'-cyclic phosphodiesterase 8